MKTLRDYELKRGDWVKLPGSEWQEFSINNNREYFFEGKNRVFAPEKEVEAVLRPSVTIRDILDKVLERLSQDVHTCEYTQPYLVFDIIKPKEPENILYEDVINELQKRPGKVNIYGALAIICDEIEALKAKK